MEAFETFEHAGLTVELHFDTEPESPREWSNLGVMYCWHPDYTLGDEQFGRGDHESMEDVISYLFRERKAKVVLPLFLYDHSGISMRASAPIARDHSTLRDLQATDRFMGDSAGWDTSHVGFIYTNDELQEEIGTPDELLAEVLASEVSTYDDYLTGQVYGYIVKGEDGEDLDTLDDSCWGFYGLEDVRSEGKSAAEHCAKEIERENIEAAYWRARGVVTA